MMGGGGRGVVGTFVAGGVHAEDVDVSDGDVERAVKVLAPSDGLERGVARGGERGGGGRRGRRCRLARAGRRRHGRARGGLRDSNQGARVHPGFGSAPAPDAPRAGKGGGSMVIRALRGAWVDTARATTSAAPRVPSRTESAVAPARARFTRAARSHEGAVRSRRGKSTSRRPLFRREKASGMRGSKVFSSTRHAVRHSTPRNLGEDTLSQS